MRPLAWLWRPRRCCRVSWAASGLSGSLAALLRPCGLDLAPERAQLLPISAAQPVALDDLQAARCALWRGLSACPLMWLQAV